MFQEKMPSLTRRFVSRAGLALALFILSPTGKQAQAQGLDFFPTNVSVSEGQHLGVLEVPTPEEESGLNRDGPPLFEKATQEVMGFLVASLEKRVAMTLGLEVSQLPLIEGYPVSWHLDTLLNHVHTLAGSPTIYLHDIKDVRAFEGGPLNKVFIPRETFMQAKENLASDSFHQSIHDEVLQDLLAELAHRPDFIDRPIRTLVRASAPYAVATLKTLFSFQFPSLANIQDHYDTFAYSGVKENGQVRFLSLNEMRTHGLNPTYAYVVEIDEEGNAKVLYSLPPRVTSQVDADANKKHADLINAGGHEGVFYEIVLKGFNNIFSLLR